MAVNQGRKPSRWLNPAGGYLAGYSHTLNPYSGCSFACSYCYVRRMPVGLFRGEPWGSWVDVKQLDEAAFRREWARESAKGAVSVFFGSATDPYQPAEAERRLTRRLLELMLERPPGFVLLQTRSPLVAGDAALFGEFGDRIRVSVTIETDDEAMRRRFSPSAPPLAARWKALQALREAGVPVQAAVSPLLPHTSEFARKLAATGARIVVDDFHRGDGSGGRRSEQLGMRELYRSLGLEADYAPAAADRFYDELLSRYPGVNAHFSQEGFLP
ncbi:MULTISPECIES: radical SAM protein [unclassified Paenibacillus]|uniref:SPL family radical SAM protein n=1 Tax=unclassified Paenibacillus TaxID=185978 RepID=UPI000953D143|nr:MULTISPECIES: radical SAM protein [unclassified Paenibacillus]ASS65905.1 radical SAM protein [Paenibacillus sp. RUD330]SIQ19471.1 DNA repair photolyase [Paenibacillus sp. RU4X]SIQ41093.1 DNA repair photolyase [Paenibacillus sp. RU4T]